MKGGTMENLKPSLFLNMDQTAVFFESKTNRVVAKKGVRTVPLRASGSDAKCCTVVVTIAADGTKLPPFFIFKAKPDKFLEKSLAKDGILGACQERGWFDETVAPKWVKQVLEPYLEGHHNALLLVDHYSVHLMSSFVDLCNNLGVDVDYVPAGYTCVLQPVDVGFNAQLKKNIRDHYHQWCIKMYKNLGNGCKIPTPDRKEIVEWVNDAYDKISSASIANTFVSIGFKTKTDEVTHSDVMDHEMETLETINNDYEFDSLIVGFDRGIMIDDKNIEYSAIN